MIDNTAGIAIIAIVAIVIARRKKGKRVTESLGIFTELLGIH